MAKNVSLPAFLNEIDDICKRVSHKELVRRVRNAAQNLPDDCRDGFLLSFRNQDPRFEPLRDEKLSIEELFLNVRERIVLIGEGKKQLDSQYNPDWDDWYNGDHQFLFTDDDCITADIESALRFIHLCIDREYYREGAEVSLLLSELRISVVGEYNDVDDTIGLRDFLYEIGIDEKYDYMNEIMYLLYMGNSLPEKCNILYNAINELDTYYSLSQLKEYENNTLPDFEAFLKSWIEFLINSDVNSNNYDINRYLFSAQSLIEDIDFLISNAKKHLRDRPEFMLHILEDHQNADPIKLLNAGDYALKHFHATNQTSGFIRSKIALATSQIASNGKQTDRVHDCWMESFRSTPNVVNFLRLRFLLPDYSKYVDCINAIINEHPRHDKVIDFFEGVFDILPDSLDSNKFSLKKVSKLNKELIALYILLLSKSDVLSDEMFALVKLFTESYELDLKELYVGSNKPTQSVECVPAFWELFKKWRLDYIISDEIANNWLIAIDYWIDNYVSSILKDLRRKEYAFCASFIAGYASIMEVMRNSSKQEIMIQYKKKYSRYPAFHRELRAMGMRDK